jgi:hypothetical protein
MRSRSVTTSQYMKSYDILALSQAVQRLFPVRTTPNATGRRYILEAL